LPRLQALRDDKVDKYMDEAMALHHYFSENSTTRCGVGGAWLLACWPAGLPLAGLQCVTPGMWCAV
jgi:hypothetical protein